MATIKLGNLELGNIRLGNASLGDVRKLTKNNMFRVHALSNHAVGKTIQASIGSNSGGGVDLGGNSGGDSTWLLSTGYWDDNGVWDDTQNWTE